MENRKPKTRIRRKNSGIKKLVLLLILLFIIIQLIRAIVPASVTLSRYVYNKVRNYYLGSKEFYFTSDKLSNGDGTFFEADNWSGLDEYRVDINMYSRKNSQEASKMDIDYVVKYSVDIYDKNNKKYSEEEEANLIEFVVKKNSGQIPASTNKDDFFFTIKLKDTATLQDDDYVLVTVEVESTKPYKEKLTGRFSISIGNIGLKYQLEDQAYRPYLDVIVTNTLNYYTVDTPFTAQGSNISYSQGNLIYVEDYRKLTLAEKENCHSMIITLDIKNEYYNELNFDTTTNMYLVAKEGTSKHSSVVEKDKNGYTYVKSISFPIDAEESKVIRVYKEIASNNYSYPFSQITVTEDGEVVAKQNPLVIDITSDFKG